MRAVLVCVENSNRSQMAEAIARMAGLRHTAPARAIGEGKPKAIEAMREVGYDQSTNCSKSLEDLPDLLDGFPSGTMCATIGKTAALDQPTLPVLGYWVSQMLQKEPF